MAATEGPDQCVLLDTFGKFVQVACGLAAFSVLLVKRYTERPRRPWIIWALDVSKQGFAMICAHFIGMLTAEIVSGSVDAGSACSWYFLAFTIDVTLGVFISLVILKVSLLGAKRCHWRILYASGDYGHTIGSKGQLVDQPRYSVWLVQTIHFALVCVAPARFICMAFTYANRSWLSDTADAISGLFAGHPKAQLLTVMLAGPLLMNAAQFLLQDQVLKLSSSVGGRRLADTSRAILVALGLLRQSRARAASASVPSQEQDIEAHRVSGLKRVDEEVGLINRSRYDSEGNAVASSELEFTSHGQAFADYGLVREEDLMLGPGAPDYLDQDAA